MWDFPRSPTGAAGIVEAAVAHGLSEADCVRGTGLSRAELDDDDRIIEARQELEVARNVVGRSGGLPGLGVAAGLRYTLGSAGGLGFAMLSSPTLRDAMAVATRYLTLSSAFVRITVEEAGTRAVTVFDGTEIPADVRTFLVKRDVASAWQMIRLVLGDEFPWADVVVGLTPDTEGCRALAEVFAGTELVAARRAVTVSIPHELFDKPLPQADPRTAAMCERQCLDLLDRRQRRRGTAAMVRALLLRDPSAMPTMDAAAQSLSVDPRTLHRRLARESTSYRALTAETRQSLAIELLAATGLTVSEVARRLGYSEVAAFSRAFTQWTGTPPSSYRRA